MAGRYGMLSWMCLGHFAFADRPEVKNDADAVITSNFTSMITSGMTSKPYPVEVGAFWSTCSFFGNDPTPTSDATLRWMKDSGWMKEAVPTDVTWHAFSVGDTGHNDHIDKCTTKRMDVVAKSAAIQIDNTKDVAMHIKYMVPAGAEETKFFELVKNMLSKPDRRTENQLTVDDTQYVFKYGYLMLHEDDNVATNTGLYKYWHILQFFAPIGDNPSISDYPDAYDQFAAARSRAMIGGLQWMKLSNRINQASIRLRHSVQNPSKKRGGAITDAVQWLSCALPFPLRNEPAKTAEFQQHFLHDDQTDPNLLAQADSQGNTRHANYHVLQFADRHENLIPYSNCRVQKLVIHKEEGEFDLDDDDVAMHMEYEIPVNDENYFQTAVDLLLKEGMANSEFKYMVILKSDAPWNGKIFWHLYQTFQTATEFATHIDGACQKFKTFRLAAQPTHKWVKQDPYVNGATPVLTMAMR